MNEGEISGGQPQGENKVFFSSSDLDASASAHSMFGESTAIMPTAQPTEAINTVNSGAKAPKKSVLGGRSRSDAIKASAAQAHPFVPNPNAPDFFNDAMRDLTPAPEPPKTSINKKPILVIVGAIALIAIVGITAVVLLRNGGGSNGNGEEPIASPELKHAFGVYANYLYYNKDSQEEFKIDDNNENQQYAVGVINEYIDLSQTEKSNYIDKLNQKYNTFAELYKKEYEDGDGLEELKLYFYYYGKIKQLHATDFVELYRANNGDRNMSIAQINSNYTSSYKNDLLDDYSKNAAESDIYMYDLTVAAINSGCVVGDKIDSDCYKSTSIYPELISKANEIGSKAYQDAIDMEKKATDRFRKVCHTIYRDGEGM